MLLCHNYIMVSGSVTLANDFCKNIYPSNLAVRTNDSRCFDLSHAPSSDPLYFTTETATGIGTQTTPTMTPTTLRSIEESLIGHQLLTPVAHQAGFVPPVVHPVVNATSDLSQYANVDKCWRHDDATSLGTDIYRTTSVAGRKNTGGRRPACNTKLPPEEEERRRLRRERNKLAAARCRKRRMDHTNLLQEKTEALQEKNRGLQKEIEQLKSERDQLEFILKRHTCSLRRKKLDITASSARSRAAYLPFSESIDVSVTTPTSGFPGLEALMEATGVSLGMGGCHILTPMAESCASQQRNSIPDLSSPDVFPPKLVSL